MLTLDILDTLDTLCRCKNGEPPQRSDLYQSGETVHEEDSPARARDSNDDRNTGDRDGTILVLWKAFTKGNKLIGRNQNLGGTKCQCVCAGQRKKETGDGRDKRPPSALGHELLHTPNNKHP